MVRNDTTHDTVYASFQSQSPPEDFGFQGLSLQPNYEPSPSDSGPSMSQDTTVFTDYNDNFYAQPTLGEVPMDQTDAYDIPVLGDFEHEVAPSEAASNKYVCDWQDEYGNLCGKKCPRQCDLTKHQKNHNRPTPCEICGHGLAEKKDLKRHMTKYHPNESAAKGIKKDEKPCPLIGCPDGYKGRPDNLKRHVMTKHPEIASDCYPVKKSSSKKGKEKAR